MNSKQLIRPSVGGFRWETVPHQPYKQDGSAPFKDISRQVLFQEDDLGCELRYFEMNARGYSTLERHRHAHAVMVLRGEGECLVGTEVRPIKRHDLVSIPSWTWHQFKASNCGPMGFLCMVNTERDPPQLPSDDELAALRSLPSVARFLGDP